MTREEAWNRIDAIIEKHEVDDVYVTINNHKDYDALRFARKLLEQEPCDELDFVQPHKKMSVNLEVCKIRKDKGVLEQLAEKQNSLLATTKAWSDAIEKNGYVN